MASGWTEGGARRPNKQPHHKQPHLDEPATTEGDGGRQAEARQTVVRQAAVRQAATRQAGATESTGYRPGEVSGETSGRGVWLAALFGVGGLFLWRLWIYRDALIDDAYISLRYGRHWIDGLGLVFNVGERVEGYTNFLWVILGGLLHRLPVDPMLGLRWMSLLAAAVMIGVSVRCLDLLSRGALPDGVVELPPVWRRVEVWILGICLLGVESLAYYATTGMETMFFAGVFLAALYFACRERGLSGAVAVGGRRSVLCFVLLALTRPEGVLLFALCHGALWAAEWLWHRSDIWRRGARSLTDGLIFAALYGAYFAWRWSYFGELFPNTYHAKVTGGPEQWWNGWLALQGWGVSHPLWVAVLAVTPWLVWRGRRRRDASMVAVFWSVCLAWLVYVVTIGGDFMPFMRFFLPVVGPLAVLTVWCGRQIPWPVHGVGRAVTGVALLLTQVMAGAWDDENLRAYVAHRTTVVGQEVGRFFAETLPSDALMAVNTVGSLPYESGLPTIDMLGLTDKAIARHPVYVISPRWAGHRRGWGEYVLGRRPQVVLWYNSSGSRDPHYLGDRQLADQPFFRFFYQAKHHDLPSSSQAAGRTLFWGTPLGTHGGDPLWLAELGAEVTTVSGRFGTWTWAEDAAVRLHYFEFRSDLEALWPYTASGNVDRFLDQVVLHWQRQAPPKGQAEMGARRAVEDLCRQARVALGRGQLDVAKELLGQAIERNRMVRSPLPYQYVANLAYLDGSLFLAVHAQLEALRLAPGNALYRNNLQSLLQKPFEDYRAETLSAGSGDSPVEGVSPSAWRGAKPKQSASRQ